MYLILLLLILFVVLYFLLQIPSVQTWTGRKAADYLSEKLEADIQVNGGIQLSFINGLGLEEVLILDAEQDTAIYLNKLYAGFVNPLTTIQEEHIDINELTLDQVLIHNQFRADHFQSNLGLLFKTKENWPKAPFRAAEINRDSSDRGMIVHIASLKVNQLKFINQNDVRGKFDVFDIGAAQLEQLDFIPKWIAVQVEKAQFEDAHIKLKSMPFDQELFNSIYVDPFVNDTSGYEEPFPFYLVLKEASLVNSSFELENKTGQPTKLTYPGEIDFKHLGLNEMNATANNIEIGDWVIKASLEDLSFVERSGLRVREADIDRLHINERSITSPSLKLVTANSDIRTNLKLSYKEYLDLQDIANKVYLNLNCSSADVSVQDIARFVPTIYGTNFYENNLKQQIFFKGNISGTLNDINARAIEVQLADELRFDGEFSYAKGATSLMNEVHLDVHNAQTSVTALRHIVPDIKLPEQFDRLGKLNFSGALNGLLGDFKASGKLVTDLGTADVNMSLNTMAGNEAASYNGKLNLVDFDLGAWTADSSLGKITIQADVEDGLGLTPETASAKIRGLIKEFEYNDYQYHNAYIKGLLKDQEFKGNFAIAEDNIQLNFSGFINAKDSLQKLKLRGNIEQLDLKKLNLYKQDLVVKSRFDIDLLNPSIDESSGSVGLFNLRIGNDSTGFNLIDTIALEAVYNSKEDKSMKLRSDILDFDVQGAYKFLTLGQAFQNYLSVNNPVFAEKLGTSFRALEEKENFKFDLEVKNTLGLIPIFAPDVKLDTVRNLSLKGYLNEYENKYELSGYVDSIYYDGTQLYGPEITSFGDGPYHNIVLAYKRLINPTLELDPLAIFADLERDTLFFQFSGMDFQSYLEDLNIAGKVGVVDHDWFFKLDDSDLSIFGEKWTVENENMVRIRNNKIEIDKFDLTNDEESIQIKSINDDNGIAVKVKEINIQRLTTLLKDKRFSFEGLLSGTVDVADVKNMNRLRADLSAPKLLINGDDFGRLSIFGNSQNIGDPVEIKVAIENQQQYLRLGGNIFFKDKNRPNDYDKLDFAINVSNFPAKVIEYFVSSGLSETNGNINARITAKDQLADPTLNGYVDIPMTSFKIDLLGVKYLIQDGRVNITSDYIDLNNINLQDVMGNIAEVSGGLQHHNLQNLTLDARIVSDEFQVLNTEQRDNDLYYGNIIGSLDVQFSGLLDAPRIVVDIENKENSKFTINTDYQAISGGLDYFDFKFGTDPVDSLKEVAAATEIDLTINLKANPEVYVELILDKSTRDIISCRGTGDLVLKFNQNELSLAGTYELEEGKYNFPYDFGNTIQSIKTFNIEKGSRIVWNGDPFDATLDIRADYDRAKAAPAKLLGNQLSSSSQLAIEAQEKTPVVVQTSLTGALESPDINFKIEMPDLTGSLKSMVESELQLLEQDQNELNIQVASLIALNDFIRTDEVQSVAAGASALATTMSEWLSNQLSYYLGGVINYLVQNVDFIDDVEVYFGIQTNTDQFEVISSAFLPNEVGVGVKFIMFNRRLELEVEGDYVNSTNTNPNIPSDYFEGEIALDYVITEDGRWRIRTFARFDQTTIGKRTKPGLGITWNREYNILREYKEELRRQAEIRKRRKRVSKQ